MKTVEKIERKLPVLKTRKRVAAYARVSMESERMQHSLSAQVSYYSALIQKNPEWEYAGVFADYGISGTGTKKRDEFNHMLAECEAGNIKADFIARKRIRNHLQMSGRQCQFLRYHALTRACRIFSKPELMT